MLIFSLFLQGVADKPPVEMQQVSAPVELSDEQLTRQLKAKLMSGSSTVLPQCAVSLTVLPQCAVSLSVLSCSLCCLGYSLCCLAQWTLLLSCCLGPISFHGTHRFCRRVQNRCRKASGCECLLTNRDYLIQFANPFQIGTFKIKLRDRGWLVISVEGSGKCTSSLAIRQYTTCVISEISHSIRLCLICIEPQLITSTWCVRVTGSEDCTRRRLGHRRLSKAAKSHTSIQTKGMANPVNCCFTLQFNKPNCVLRCSSDSNTWSVKLFKG